MSRDRYNGARLFQLTPPANVAGMTTHQMTLEASYPQEFLFVCPTCARKLVMKTGADAGMVVLEEGDPTAMHSGGAGLSISAEIGE